jgi:hypothetical protein
MNPLYAGVLVVIAVLPSLALLLVLQRLLRDKEKKLELDNRELIAAMRRKNLKVINGGKKGGL